MYTDFKNFDLLFCTLLFILLFPTGTLAQAGISINGTVSDAETGSPLPFAGLRIEGTDFGSICRADGSFSKMIPQKYADHSLTISYLGYKSQTIRISSFSKYEKISLHAEDKAINEVTIRPGMAEQLIEKALEKVPDNFRAQDINQRAYYKETVKDNGLYCEYIEMQLNILKRDYSSGKTDQIEPLQGRQKEGLVQSDLYKYVYFINGPYEALQSDIAKNPKHFISIPRHSLNFLHHRHFKFYYYSFRYIPEIHDEVFVIDFKPKTSYAFYTGRLILDRKTLVFRALYYEISAEHIQNAQLMPTAVQNSLAGEGVSTQALSYQCTVLYENTDNINQFRYAQITYNEIFKNRNKNTADTISYNSELFITESLQKEPENIRIWHRFMHDVNIRYQIPSYNAAFWKSYNVPDIEAYKKQSKYHKFLK